MRSRQLLTPLLRHLEHELHTGVGILATVVSAVVLLNHTVQNLAHERAQCALEGRAASMRIDNRRVDTPTMTELERQQVTFETMSDENRIGCDDLQEAPLSVGQIGFDALKHRFGYAREARIEIDHLGARHDERLVHALEPMIDYRDLRHLEAGQRVDHFAVERVDASTGRRLVRLGVAGRYEAFGEVDVMRHVSLGDRAAG